MSNIIKTKIAGVFKYPDAKPIMKGMQPGTLFKWKAEPDNPYDPNAIELFVAGEHDWVKCGYVPKAVASSLTANRISAIVKGAESFDAIDITTTGE